MSDKTLLFSKVALLLSFLLMTTAGCPATSSKQGNETLTVTQPYANATPPEITDVPTPEDTPFVIQPFSIFYVSLAGNNADGRSWDTAWNELDQIQWEEVSPGDTILIGGGEYHTQMDVGKSGSPGMPITITTNSKQVVLDGQRPALPYCGQLDYIPVSSDDAIDLEGQSFIVIDGQDWRGIVIRNHSRGINMREDASNIVVRNVEIHDNGYASDSASNTMPDGPGVRLGGSDILFERVIIHDNGQDAFQAGWGVWNFTLRNSWLYNSQEHLSVHGKSFNYCSHTDGIQIYDGGLQGPVIIEDSIIGPSFTQGLIIGSKATVNDVVIKNTLFVSNDNAGIIISDGGRSSNWTLQNVTIAQDVMDEKSGNITMHGNGHQIRDSVFRGGSWGIMIFNWSEAIGNSHWLTPDLYGVAVEMNPVFADDDYSLFQGEGFADFDFTIQNPAIPPGVGSAITSVNKLFDQ